MNSDEERPIDRINRLIEQRRDWSDEAVLEALTNLAVLPDESDAQWRDMQTWHQAELFVAFGKLAAERHLKPAIPLLLERACYGDPGEVMRGLRHSLEESVQGDWTALGDICEQAAKSVLPGSRLWAIRELGVLRDANFLQTVIDALQDNALLVRQEACVSLEMICQKHTDVRLKAIEALTQYENTQTHTLEINAAHNAINTIRQYTN